MENVRVKTSKLLKVAKSNYDDYCELYLESEKVFNELFKSEVDGWIDELEIKITALRTSFANSLKETCESGKLNTDFEKIDFRSVLNQPSNFFHSNKPVDYRERFKEKIEMLEYESREELSLNRKEWRELVKCKWDWIEREVGKSQALYAYATGPIGVSGATGSQGPVGVSGLEASLRKTSKWD